jgi:CRP/FNR family transcriptional regulator, nitrogen oxide reductase regulator
MGEHMKKARPDLVADPSDLYSSQPSLAMSETKQALPWVTTPELFEGLAYSDGLRILSTGCHMEIPSGEVIFRAGDTTKIFLLIEGRAKVTQVTEDGREVVLWLNTPGQIIGSLNLASHIHSSTAKALRRCKVLMWDLCAFEDNIDRFPALFRNVMRIGALQMSEMSRRICEVSTEEATPRLARSLIRLSEQLGRSVNGQLEIDLTQEALAQMTGMNMFTLNRYLSEWERQQIVICQRSAVVIRDLQGLKRLCGAAA